MFGSEWRQWLRRTIQVFPRGKARKTRAGQPASRFRPWLEPLEDRLAPATAQFSVGSETVNQAAGTFSIPVTLSAAVPPTVSTFASGFKAPTGQAVDAAGNLYV